MGNIMTINPGILQSRNCTNFSDRGYEGFPPEFCHLPRFYPPDMTSNCNPDKSWLVYDAWKAPAIDGKVVCYRGAVTLENGSLAGYFTDGISVPSCVWTALDMQPFSMPELCFALGHDMAYSAELSSRSECDRWLSEWAKMIKLSNTRRRTVYCAVNLLGWFVWNKHTKQSIEDARAMCQLVDVGTEPVWKDTIGGVKVAQPF